MTNYGAWDAKAEALAKEAEEEAKREEAENNKALGLEGGPRGPATAKAEAELGDLDEKSKQRKDFIEWSKAREVSRTDSAQEAPLEVPAAEVEGKALRISGSEGVTYVLPAGMVKLMVDKCKRVTIRAEATITTSTVELYGCEEVDLELGQPLGTLQVDECTAPVRVRYAERDHVGRIYHQNSPGLLVGWGAGAGSLHTVGAEGAVQLWTALAPESAREVFETRPVRRGEGEYPVDLLRPGQTAGAPAAESQPEPEQAPAQERQRQLAEERRQEGNEMFRANDFMQATVHYTEALQLDPTASAVWANRAQCYLKLGEHERALADAIKCTEVEPANPKGWFRKGMSLHAMQRYAEAVPALLEAEKLEPQNKQVVDAIKMAQLMARKSAAAA